MKDINYALILEMILIFYRRLQFIKSCVLNLVYLRIKSLATLARPLTIWKGGKRLHSDRKQGIYYINDHYFISFDHCTDDVQF